MNFETTIQLNWKVEVFVSKKMPFTLSVFTDRNHCVTVNLNCGKSRFVGL